MKSSTPESSQEINGPIFGEKIQSPPSSTVPTKPQWKPVTDSPNKGIEVDQDGKFRTNIPENGSR